MSSKRKSDFQTPEEKRTRRSNSQDEGPYQTDSPKANQLSPGELNHSSSPPTVISSSNQQPTISDNVASTSVALLPSTSTQDHSETSYPTLRSPSQQNVLRGSSATAGPRSIQDEDSRGGSFTNAHDFTIGSAIFYNSDRREEDRRAEEERRDREEKRAEEERNAREEERAGREKRAKEEQEAEERRQEEKALEKLAARGMPSAMLDSKDRGYIPRCHEDTRQTLRGRVVRWKRNDKDSRCLFWLSGPAGVGKSAVAQTVAEELKAEGLLGAVFFFSRPNNRSDPDAVIPTVVYQLALLLPQYRRIITLRLIADPLLLSKSRRSQFQELIIDPLLALTPCPPLLVVLDGLDECRDRNAQTEFVEMISYYARKEKDIQFRWMICSRPEPHLRVAFSREDCRAICLEEKLEVDNNEARMDARQILERGFADIRQRYPDQLTEDWPAERQICSIMDRASGHLGFVSFIIRFIGDEQYDDPSGQLDVCLQFLERVIVATDANPLYALDLLYTQILSDIPTKILPTTQRILGLSIFYDNTDLTAVAHANFLGLDQAAFYRSLQHLHSVLLVPSPSEAGRKPIQVYHASFSDFLKDQTRSGKFFLEEAVVPYLDVAISGLRWLAYGHRDPYSCVTQILVLTGLLTDLDDRTSRADSHVDSAQSSS